jgi:hypothetical protein
MSEEKIKTYGTRAEVWHGTAKKTKGGLTKDNLTKNKYGRIVSKRMVERGKKLYKKSKEDGVLAKPFESKSK